MRPAFAGGLPMTFQPLANGPDQVIMGKLVTGLAGTLAGFQPGLVRLVNRGLDLDGGDQAEVMIQDLQEVGKISGPTGIPGSLPQFLATLRGTAKDCTRRRQQ